MPNLDPAIVQRIAPWLTVFSRTGEVVSDLAPAMVRKALTAAPASPVASTGSAPGGTALPLGSSGQASALSQAMGSTQPASGAGTGSGTTGTTTGGLGAATTTDTQASSTSTIGTGSTSLGTTSLGTTQSTGSAAGSSGSTGDLLGTDSTGKRTQEAGSSDPKNLYRLTLVARTPAGLVTRHTVVIWLDGRADRPYRVLDWSPPELAGQEIG